MRTWKDSLKLFRYNLPAVILFEITYKLLALAVLLPVIYSLLHFSVELAEIKYLTAGYMKRYLSSPSTYGIFFIIILLVGIYVLINISAIIYAMEYSHKGEKTNALILLVKGLGNALRIIRPGNAGILLQVVLVIPYTYTVMVSGSLLGLKLPDFVQRVMEQHRFILGIAVGIYLLLGIVAMLRIYTLNYYTIYKLTYRESVRISKKAIKRHIVREIAGIIMYNIFMILILLLLEGVFTTVFAGILKNVISYKRLKFVINTAIQILFVILYILFSLVSTPLVYSYVCAGFYRLEDEGVCERSTEAITGKKNKKHLEETLQEKKKKRKIVSVLMVVFGLILNGTYIYLLANNKISLNIAYSTRASVTAHRGDAEYAPENTMAAFRMAVENQADIIELDVRQTKDGKYIVMHDESLYRTTGVDKLVGELTYDEIKLLDAGSSFSEEYAGEHVPSLEEVIDFALENDVFLNIEIKPADTDSDYEEGFVTLLEEKDFIDECVVASADYNVIKKVKQLNPDITTVYIMSMAFGEFGDMEYVDIFSIRHTFVSSDMVKNIHRNDKEIYVWTVDNEESIKRLLLLDVDSIITNDPYNTKDIIYNANDSLLSDWLQRLVENY